MTQMHVEYTDTFSGEANYSWVRRYSENVDSNISDAKVKRLAKSLAGLSGVRGKWDDMGSSFAFRPSGSCTVMFVSFN